MASPRRDAAHLRGLVDMGSNGIRFSVSTLQPPTERIMPTLYQSRAGISLYDAQYSASGERIPIDDHTISAVLSAFQQFKRTCNDFEVPDEHITVLATEATRTAVNSEAFRKRIKDHVGWDVVMLSKEDEGRVGAMGIASSLPELSGLVMDLGGGSTQLSWLIKKKNLDEVLMPASGSVSMPYGAAAMSRRLTEAEENGTTGLLRREITEAVAKAFDALQVPPELHTAARKRGGFTLYLSGGGFRGWGYVLMSRHRISPYPVAVINGFKASRDEFLNTEDVKQAAAATLDDDTGTEDIFRVSDRRASQVPAVAFLVTVLAETLPQIKEVRFCQGGVREGHLFSSLSSTIRAQHPLVIATQFLSHSVSDSSHAIADLLSSALPLPDSTHASQDLYRDTFTPEVLAAFANTMYLHSSYSKDLQGTAALRSTTSGPLAGVHGLLHESRALLALLLCARWGGAVPPTDEMFKRTLEQLLESPWTLWWINYLGAVAALIAAVYPAGTVPSSGPSAKSTAKRRLHLAATWTESKKGHEQLVLNVTMHDTDDVTALAKEIRDIEKLGKKKRWVEGMGAKVLVAIKQG